MTCDHDSLPMDASCDVEEPHEETCDT
jgi:hypothetical protein